MVSSSNIVKIASKYKSYIEKNKKTPANITLGDKTYSYQQCAYMFSKFIISPKQDISLIKIGSAPNPNGDSINENILINDYKDMAKRFNSYVEKNKKLPNFVTTKKSKKKVKMNLFIYICSKIVVFFGSKKIYPNYVATNSSAFKKTTNSTTTSTVKKQTTSVKKSKYGHATKSGCDNMGQNTPYYCGCHSLQEIFRNLTGIVVPQSTIAKWAGTTSSGTGHEGLNTAVAKFNQVYKKNLKVEWKHFSDIGWNGLNNIIKSSNKDFLVHNLYRNKWGHYEVINSISSSVNTQNSLGSSCGSCYCGYKESRSKGDFQSYIKGISQKSIMIVTRG